MIRKYTHLSLFSGVGGLDLAAEAAGFTTVGQVERAEYQRKVLARHWPDVPRWADIKTLTGKGFYHRTGLRTVDIISGGFPCQPFSKAGKQRAKDDDRYLWPEMLRVICEFRPTWVLGENVTGIIDLALDTVLTDLEAAGYAARAFTIPACSVGAPHRRNRVAIVAHAVDWGSTLRWDWELPGITEAAASRDFNSGRTPPALEWSRWDNEPGVPRVADGVSDRLDRINCIGNAVVPQQFYPFFAAIMAVIRYKEEPWQPKTSIP